MGRRARTAACLIVLAAAGAVPAEAGLLVDITLEGPPRPAPGVGAFYGGRVNAAGALPLPAQNVRIRVDGVLRAGIPTDTAGMYGLSLTFPEPGPHVIRATVFDGTALATSVELEVLAVEAADMTAELAVPATVGVGTEFEILATATNLGPNTATGAAIVTTLAGPGTVVSATAEGRDCAVSANTVTCALGDIGADAPRAALIVARADAPGRLTVDATASAAEHDPTPANDSASATTDAG